MQIGDMVRHKTTGRIMMIVEVLEDRDLARTNDIDFRTVPLEKLKKIESL